MSENNIPESEIRLTGEAYKLRCIECERSQSKAGNPMLVQTFEIIENKPIIQEGEEVDINGVKIFNFTSLIDSMHVNVNYQRVALGLVKVTKAELDNINPLDYIGSVGWAYCDSKAEEMKNSVTKQPVINPLTGLPEVIWTKRIVRYPSVKKG